MTKLETAPAPLPGLVPSLSVVMPAHNEHRTIAAAVRQVLSLDVPWSFELIVVDDGSTDVTARALSGFDDDRLKIVPHTVNRGKGQAVRTGAALAQGTHLVIYDADCEYRASDLVRMFGVVLAGKADVVYGTRDFSASPAGSPFHYALGRRLTTVAANLLFSANLSDLHTCLKMIPLDVFHSLELSETGFGLDTEITAELLRRGHTVYEVPVSYVGRSHADGKQIGWRDGIDCLMVMAQVRRRARPTPSIDLTTLGVEVDLSRSQVASVGSQVAC